MANKQHSEHLDRETVQGFGDEWQRFPQDALSEGELSERFNEYFSLFPWGELSDAAAGFDMGCGSGRWAKLVADRVGTLNCVDPSEMALAVAKKQLADKKNCVFHNCSAEQMPFPENSQDFGYSLGVLHHIPDTDAALISCVKRLKPGAPLLLYLYYAFDNKPRWYRWIWRASELLRFWICKSPYELRYVISQLIAAVVYYPMAKLSLWCEKFGVNVSNFPLSYYRKYSFYSMRTDALDRFGTRLEKRFTRSEIKSLMQSCGLEKIHFSNNAPFWVVIGRKKVN